jgi:DNA-directed RNA polymerase specialized sigma24 family protein
MASTTDRMSAPRVALSAAEFEYAVAALHSELGRIVSREACEDAVQDALIAALEHDEQLANLGGFVHARGRHRLLDGWRRTVGRHRDPAQRRRFVSVDDVTVEEYGSDPELLALVQHEAGQEASDTFARLPEGHRRVLTLRLEGATTVEIAEVLGVSEAAAESRVRRAWDALRALFVATERDDTCAAVRAVLTLRPVQHTPDVTGERARIGVHLEGCVHCRAYQKRLRGLLVLTPAAALPVWQRVLVWIAEHLPASPAPRGAGEVASGTVAGAGTAGGLAGIAGSKLAAVCAGATLAACATGAIAVLPDRDTRPAPPRGTAAAPTPTATPTATPTPAPTTVATVASARAKTRAKPRRNAQSSSRKASTTAVVRRDTQAAERVQAASAPADSNSASEFEPSGAGSDAPLPAAPAPVTGGGEFTP